MGDIPVMIANIEITDQGREWLQRNRRESDGASGDIDDSLPIFAKRRFENDIAALSASTTISSRLAEERANIFQSGAEVPPQSAMARISADANL
jgi:hypothetical protein